MCEGRYRGEGLKNRKAFDLSSPPRRRVAFAIRAIVAGNHDQPLARWLNRTALFELLDHAIEIGIAGAKAPCEPVPTALSYALAVGDNLELTVLTRCEYGVDVEAILDEGHETRDLGFVVLSSRAVNDLDLHYYSVLQFACCGPPAAQCAAVSYRDASSDNNPIIVFDPWNGKPAHYASSRKRPTPPCHTASPCYRRAAAPSIESFFTASRASLAWSSGKAVTFRPEADVAGDLQEIAGVVRGSCWRHYEAGARPREAGHSQTQEYDPGEWH